MLVNKGRLSSKAEFSIAGLDVYKTKPSDKIITLAGNPNVGKSTVFNALTGLKQHTGNWPGKTVINTQGYFKKDDQGFVLIDIPGSYSLMARTEEELVARDFTVFAPVDAVVVVCDATSLKRNLNLVLQIIETGKKVIVCVNLVDEAKKRGITIDSKKLSELLGVQVVKTAARSRYGLDELVECLKNFDLKKDTPINLVHSDFIEDAVKELQPLIAKKLKTDLSTRYVALRLLDADSAFKQSMKENLKVDLWEDIEISACLEKIKKEFKEKNISALDVGDKISSKYVVTASEIAEKVVTFTKAAPDKKDRMLDKLFTSKATGIPIMITLLFLVFYFTIAGAEPLSEFVGKCTFLLEEKLEELVVFLGIKGTITDILIHGVYNVIAWVVSVMLPPMAIFFPIFTLLEDFGYLPRVAFNLDKGFQWSNACGKQALTMCMGFGCNCAGVTGARIIDSTRERLIAIITNNFVPCNGRFPILIAVITMFLAGKKTGLSGSLIGAAILSLVILLSVVLTLLVSKLLSLTVLKGYPSSFTIELPPYRKPQIGTVIVRSVIDRTLKVLWRAICAAAPAGLIIWFLGNITTQNGTSYLTYMTSFLDPLGKLMGMDGTALSGFILGLPANEIVMPTMMMAYTHGTGLIELSDLDFYNLLQANGWTWITAINVLIFTVCHWPCATALLTIREETQSTKWTVVSFLLPTVIGMILCISFTALMRVIV